MLVAGICAAALLLMAALLSPVVMFASGGMLAESGTSCTSGSNSSTTAQPVASVSARNSIPANYLALFRSIGAQYKVPWVILGGHRQGRE